jgi:hypothetical protein
MVSLDAIPFGADRDEITSIPSYSYSPAGVKNAGYRGFSNGDN